MTETDEKLALSGGATAALTWESRAAGDGALLRELLGVIRKLCGRLDALEAEKKAAEEEKQREAAGGEKAAEIAAEVAEKPEKTEKPEEKAESAQPRRRRRP